MIVKQLVKKHKRSIGLINELYRTLSTNLLR